MGKIINLDQHRRKSRQTYLAKYGARIDLIIEAFVVVHVDVDFLQLAEDYQSGHSESWDYVHFREVLAEALDEAFGKTIYQMLRTQSWFKANLISQDEVIERCLSTYVLNHCARASSSSSVP